MVASTRGSDCRASGLERCVHTNLSAVAWARSRPDGSLTVRENGYGIGYGFRLRSIHSLPARFELVLASFEPSEQSDRPIEWVRELVGEL